MPYIDAATRKRYEQARKQEEAAAERRRERKEREQFGIFLCGVFDVVYGGPWDFVFDGRRTGGTEFFRNSRIEDD